MEFLGEEGEPGVAGEVDEADGFGGAADLEDIAGVEPSVVLAVDGEEEFFLGLDDAGGDEELVGKDEGAVA